MLGSRAVRDTIRRIKKSEGRGGWGPKSGVNDAPKLLASVALFVGCRVGCLLLETWLSDGPDPVLRTILDTAAALAGLRVLFYTIRRPLMRALLRGQPWARPECPPAAATLWEMALALAQPGNASTAFLERVLPPLPSPGPARALQRYLEALAPTATAPALDAAASSVQELLSAGPRVLDQDMARCAKEHACDWAFACTWKEPLVHRDASLLGRCYYLLDRQAVPDEARGKQTMRAAVLTTRLLDFMKRVGNCTIPCRGLMSRAHPVPKIVPGCVQAFETLFATSIEPLQTQDVHVPQMCQRSFASCSHHIVVLCHGQAVEVPVRDSSGARVSEGQLMNLLGSAEAAAKRRDAARKQERLWNLDTLAWLPWSEWGQAVAGLEAEADMPSQSDRGCTQTLAIEKVWTAALVVALDATLPSWPQAHDALSNRALGVLLGPSPACRGAGRWRGGAFCLVVQPDGYAGLCCTLPLAEPWAAAQMWEFALSKERYPLSLGDSDAEVAVPRCIRVQPLGTVAAAETQRRIGDALSSFARAAQGMELRILIVKDIGWRVLQRLKVSPAALIHLAAQVAFFRVQGAAAFSSIALDSVPTRLFMGGRSDWVCTTTSLTIQFVKAFCDGMPKTGSTLTQTRAKRRSLLGQACKALHELQRETSLGNGFLRFLLALRGSSTCSHRQSLLRTLLPLQSSDLPSVGICTWLCEMQTDPKTPMAALSLGGGGGFCMAGADAGCRVGVSPVGDAQLVLHVSCSRPKSDAPPPHPPSAPAQEQGDNDEFVDCEDDVEEDSAGNRQETGTTVASSDGKSVDGRSHPSAGAVAREMERALYEMVDLLAQT